MRVDGLPAKTREQIQGLGSGHVSVESNFPWKVAHLGADTKAVGLTVLTQYECFSGAGPNQVEKDADGSRFPRAIEAEEAEDLSVRYFQVKTIDRQEPAVLL